MIPCVDTKIRVPYEMYQKIAALKDAKKIKSVNQFVLEALEDRLAKKKGVPHDTKASR